MAALLAELSWWEAVILGIVQGTSEWLPISSTGHLIIAQELLGLATPPLLVLILHVGTLLAVVVAYWGRLWVLAKSILPGGSSDDRKYVGLLVIGTVPIVVAGFVFEQFVLDAFDGLRTTALGLIATGFILTSTRWVKARATLGWKQALVTGFGQALALLPGVSRSGSTIAAGLHAGIERRQAADLAFLLSVPALVGAVVLQSRDVGEVDLPWAATLLGLAVSFVVGLLTIRWLIGFVSRRGLAPFAPYCFAVGAIALWTTF